MSAESLPLSTSALAKRLKLPIQQLFVTLRDYGWIERFDEGWALTAKGKLHGGDYQNSKRYGRYIVWPESLTEHPLISAIESDQRVTAGAMCRYYSHLSARQINRLLEEMGLLRSSPLGQKLTTLGERFGGREELDADSALSVVNWPHEIVDEPVIQRELNRLVSHGKTEPEEPHTESEPEDEPTPDLFKASTTATATDESALPVRCGLDGHLVDSLLQLRVCDWLYEAQLAHAQNRALPVEETLSADFYVPAAGLFIECWERDVPTAELTRRLRTREVCREMGLPYLEVAAADTERIDSLLSAKLATLGVAR